MAAERGVPYASCQTRMVPLQRSRRVALPACPPIAIHAGVVFLRDPRLARAGTGMLIAPVLPSSWPSAWR